MIDLFKKYWRKRTLLGIILVVSFHTTGANFLNYYSNVILEKNVGKSEATFFSLLHASADLASSTLDFYLLEKVGRKKLYCTG